MTNEETVMHLVSGCVNLTQKQYKRRHVNVARRVYWGLYKKHRQESSDKWYEHTPADVVENDEVELYCDLNTQTDKTPDIILVEKAIRKWTIINNAIPGNFNVVRTEN